ncbi:MAG: DNA polymerase III subunit beta [Humidesulfovibrio sp.]|uniref:DNA polymerase III subunit beta n=1 Tax=Humidesulfovibrio sp. TaxID=2910988 RepID=UPI0027E5CDA1|nr:DNA polymerase III subunit beta [Humidesulfovibrio sp.]MDQ7836707.1 DNA polymerase III subunit beta [Humidesulfovibrio sp.]
MFVKVNRDEIIEGLQKSAGIIPAKTGAAFLRSIWLEAAEGSLKIMSTDSSLEFCGEYPARVETPGRVGVQGRAFCDLVRKLPAGEMTLKADAEGKNVLVEQGSRKYKLPANEPEWFQDFAPFPDAAPAEGGTEAGTVFWSGDFLHEIIDKIAFCISEEDSMEAIACLYLKPEQDAQGKRVEVCGLNGHQFAMFTFVNDDIFNLLPREGALIQRKYLTELKKWLGSEEIELSLGEKRLFLRTGDHRETFSLPLSFYQYPNYQGFLSKLKDPESSRLTVHRGELMESLERISIFNTDSNRCTYFLFSPGEVVLYSQGQDVGTAQEPLGAAFQGDLQRIAFPTRNLIEILSHYTSEQVTFILTGPEAPCGIAGDKDQNYSVIIMPMMIQDETYYAEENA